ncbi:MAG: TIGR02530 family flagellar biosynthesis protein [Solirubrobacteraceae bacterium]|jgi:flagellar operon protein
MSPISNPALVPPGGLAAPVTPAGGAKGSGAPSETARKAGSGPSFADTLAQAGQSGVAGDLSFSKHALARVERRGIELDPSTLGRLSQGVQRAASKGSRDSLVLVDGTAFVVSVSNRTVITAVGSEHMKDNVFTNIDSAVIA